MLKYILFIIVITNSFAKINIHSFQSPFIQKITNDQNKTILYKGEVYFQSPNLTLWRYEKPIKKTILFDGSRLILIEPELEQATITKFKKEQNLLSLLQKAKKIDNDLYAVDLNKKRFLIHTRKGKIVKVEYNDELANHVVIEFLKPKQNIKISQQIFEVSIPKEYDLIYQ